MTDNPFDTKPEDILNTGLRAVISALPVLGGPALEFFALAVVQPSQERRDDFLKDVFSRVKQLEEDFDALNPENLKGNESFQATCIQAVNAALRTADAAKREALRNAVINSAIAVDLEETTRQMFMNCIDRLTPLQVSLLKLFRDPTASSAAMARMNGLMAGGLIEIVRATIPQLGANENLAKMLVAELESMGLTSGTALNVTMSANGLISKRTTPFGDAFLMFITDPETGLVPSP